MTFQLVALMYACQPKKEIMLQFYKEMTTCETEQDFKINEYISSTKGCRTT